MQEKHIIINGKKLYYKEHGSGSETIVLVHGFGEDSRVWDNQIEALKDYHLIMPDLPGSGQSEMIDNMSMEGMAEVLRLLAHPDLPGGKGTITQPSPVGNSENKVEGLQSKVSEMASPPPADLGGGSAGLVMIGHSMGGYITLAFAEKYPELLKGFGLFHSSAFADSEEKKDTRRKGIDFINKNGAFEFLKTATPNLYSPETKEKNPELIEQQISLLDNFSDAALVSYYESMMKRPDRTSVLKTTELPVLFILGKYDNAVPLADGLKQCYLPSVSYIHILEQSAHMGMQEEPKEATEMITNFIKSI